MDTISWELIDYRINEPGFMTEVSDQRSQGCCLAVATADCVSMVMHISKEDAHALVSAQYPSKHYLYVKNSYGKGLGHDGFSLIGFNVINYIIVPEYEEEKEEGKEEEIFVPSHYTEVYAALPQKKS